MALRPLQRIRNIGIVAHIDAGKTTTTERFLYYAGSTHKIGEVHDGNTVMDFRDDERERGITISAAATTFLWNDHQINLIDTPGHIDFTAEVERSLRVLDGAVVVFSGVEGVEPQSETVWHQANRYQVPRLAFINKIDRVGADHERVLEAINSRLGARAGFVNVPHGLESDLDGVIDLITLEWLVFDPESRGLEVERRPLPTGAAKRARYWRDRLMEDTADLVDWFADLYLSGQPIPPDVLRRAIREATVSHQFVPVLCGAALRDLGITPVLDAVCDFLPAPSDRPPAAGVHPATGGDEHRPADPRQPFSALVFKVVATPNVDVFWMRVYSGALAHDERCLHPRTGTRLRLRHLLRIHADRSEVVTSADCGDIVAVPGLRNVVTGDTLCDLEHPITFEPIRFPETVVSAAVEPQTSADRDRLMDVAARLAREDPTFTFHTDEETGQLLLSGMGELHLEVLARRMEREFNVRARLGRPRVAYRETASMRGRGTAEFNRVAGDLHLNAKATVEVTPIEMRADRSRAKVVDVSLDGLSTLPVPLREAAKQVLLDTCSAGGPRGFPVVDVSVRVLEVELREAPDPSVPLLAALTMALRKAFSAAGMVLLEPIMRLDARAPEEFLGSLVRDLNARRAEIQQTDVHRPLVAIHALVPLAEMFGYSTELRSLTQGRGSFSMEPLEYRKVGQTE